MNDYTARYGLEFNPFIKNARDILLETAESSEARTRLGYLKDTRGFGVLTGEPGRGKTTAARAWAGSLSPSLFKVSYSSLSSLTVMDFTGRSLPAWGQSPVSAKTSCLMTSTMR